MPQRVHESIEVQAPLEDVFQYWSNFARMAELSGPQAQTPSR